MWLVDEEANRISNNKDEVNFDRVFCPHCYMGVVLVDGQERATVVSPLIAKSKRFLRFDYKLAPSAQLTVRLIYERDALSVERSVPLATLTSPTATTTKTSGITASPMDETKWRTAVIRIASQLFHNYRVVFLLEKQRRDDNDSDNTTTQSRWTMPVAARLDNIQLFEQEVECSSSSTTSTSDEKPCDFFELANQDEDDDNKNNNNDLDADDADVPKRTCQRYATPCEANKCANNAVCINREDLDGSRQAATRTRRATSSSDTTTTTDDSQVGYVCLCPYGFTGKLCEQALNPCDSRDFNKCANNSTCIPITTPLQSSASAANSYTCKCARGYHGKHCELKYTPCKNTSLVTNPCNQLTEQGTCEDQATRDEPNKYKCTCAPMYTGENCETKLTDKCLASQCNREDKAAECVELGDKFVCRCSPGFRGPACTNIDDCASAPCQNNATCVDGVNSFECKCARGFAGKYCHVDTVCQQCDPEGTLYCDKQATGKQASRCVCKATHIGERCESLLDPCLEVCSPY